MLLSQDLIQRPLGSTEGSAHSIRRGLVQPHIRVSFLGRPTIKVKGWRWLHQPRAPVPAPASQHVLLGHISFAATQNLALLIGYLRLLNNCNPSLKYSISSARLYGNYKCNQYYCVAHNKLSHKTEFSSALGNLQFRRYIY